MSFILDALRKSENERREQAAPTLAAAPRAAPEKKRTVWLPILAVVLAIIAIVFGILLLTRDNPAPVATPALPPTESKAPPVRQVPVVETAPMTRVTEPATPSITTAPTRPATPVAAPDSSPFTSIQERLPSYGQLLSSGLISAANMRIDMHVYSDDPAKRLVFVNMTKYREGDRVAEGPTIEEITPEGAIMVQQGQRFLLDRD